MADVSWMEVVWDHLAESEPEKIDLMGNQTATDPLTGEETTKLDLYLKEKSKDAAKMYVRVRDQLAKKMPEGNAAQAAWEWVVRVYLNPKA